MTSAWTAKNEMAGVIEHVRSDLESVQDNLSGGGSSAHDGQSLTLMVEGYQRRLRALEEISSRIPEDLVLPPEANRAFRERLDLVSTRMSKLSPDDVVAFAVRHRMQSRWERLVGLGSKLFSPTDRMEVAQEKPLPPYLRVEGLSEILDLSHPRLQANTNWGDPRPGHDEGKIVDHLKELRGNFDFIDRFLKGSQSEPRLSPEERIKLLLLVNVHDSFKSEATPGVGIFDQRSHASIATRFLRDYVPDQDLLEMVQRHDEPFALSKRLQNWRDKDAVRLRTLIDSIQDWDTFCLFQIIDNVTVSKVGMEVSNFDPTEWFLKKVDPLVPLRRDYLSIYKALRDHVIDHSPR